jgi:hypothetical protein
MCNISQVAVCPENNEVSVSACTRWALQVLLLLVSVGTSTHNAWVFFPKKKALAHRRLNNDGL